MIELLKLLHEKGYFHSDLKLDNIMIGDPNLNRSNMNKLHLIDFGSSKTYLNEDGSHVAEQNEVPFKGNILFQSKNAFKKKSLSRRDDIISLGYILIFLLNTNQSWVDKNRSIAS